jgi:hypothetical protein
MIIHSQRSKPQTRAEKRITRLHCYSLREDDLMSLMMKILDEVKKKTSS